MGIFKWKKGPQLDREAFLAYFHKLPASIQVKWFRDGSYIIGEIEAENEKYMTQARDADEFIDMVNESLYAAYDIPQDYFSALRSASREFLPSADQYKELSDGKVKHSTFFVKKVQRTELA